MISKIAINMFRCLILDRVLLLSLFLTYPHHLFIHSIMFASILKSRVWVDLGLCDSGFVYFVLLVGYASVTTWLHVRYIFDDLHH
jgi:hypothetical protein